METSILITIKKMLGLDPDDDGFDVDVIVAINSALMILGQFGIGPETGFSIENEGAEWRDLLGDAENLEGVKTLVYLQTRLIFDPPASQVIVDSMTRMIAELQWRLVAKLESGGGGG